MAKINLLPPDLGPNASVLRFINLVKKIAVTLSIAFFVFGTLLVGYIIFLRMELQASAKRMYGYKVSITNLKSTELSMYILKERVVAIKKLLAIKTEVDPLGSSGSFLLNHPGVTLTQVSTTPGKVTVSGNSPSSNFLNSFFENLISNNSYKSIKLASFLFNPKAGYIFSLDLNLK